MALVIKNWSLNSYTTGTWTPVVDAVTDSLVKNLLISTSDVSAIVRARIVDANGDSIAVLIPEEELVPYTGYAMDVSLISLEAGQKLQIWASAPGVSFSANGAAQAAA